MITAITFALWAVSPIEMKKTLGMTILVISLILAMVTDMALIKLLLTI